MVPRYVQRYVSTVPATSARLPALSAHLYMGLLFFGAVDCTLPAAGSADSSPRGCGDQVTLMMRVFRASYIVDATVQLSNARSRTMMGLCGTNDGNKCASLRAHLWPWLESPLLCTWCWRGACAHCPLSVIMMCVCPCAYTRAG